MIVPLWMWATTVIGLVGIITIDLLIVDRRPHHFSSTDAARWVSFYILLAVLFAIFLGFYFGWSYAGQFTAGYLTEYSLSVDNLFVFLIIMTAFAVPDQHQHRVLLVGIVIALILRAILILVGAELIARFTGIFSYSVPFSSIRLTKFGPIRAVIRTHRAMGSCDLWGVDSRPPRIPRDGFIRQYRRAADAHPNGDGDDCHRYDRSAICPR